MDSSTGELWDKKSLDELRAISEQHAEELEQRLVQIYGTQEAIEELSTNVALGAQAKRQAHEVSELEQLARDRARQNWKRKK